MAIEKQCLLCQNASLTRFGEVNCKHFGFTPKIDNSPCPVFSKRQQSSMAKKTCPECGEQYNINFKACPNCGEPNNTSFQTQSKHAENRCPKCGKEFFSSLTNRCPNCKYELNSVKLQTPNKLTCSECGSIYNDNLKSCPNCGEPNALLNKSINQKNNTNHRKSTTKWIILAIVIVVIVFLVVMIKSCSDRREAEQRQIAKEKARIEAQQRLEEELQRIEAEIIAAEKERIQMEEYKKSQVPNWLLGEWVTEEVEIDPSTYDMITTYLTVTRYGFTVTISRSNGGGYSMRKDWDGMITEGNTVYGPSGNVLFSINSSHDRLRYSGKTYRRN